MRQYIRVSTCACTASVMLSHLSAQTLTTCSRNTPTPMAWEVSDGRRRAPRQRRDAPCARRSYTAFAWHPGQQPTVPSAVAWVVQTLAHQVAMVQCGWGTTGQMLHHTQTAPSADHSARQTTARLPWTLGQAARAMWLAGARTAVPMPAKRTRQPQVRPHSPIGGHSALITVHNTAIDTTNIVNWVGLHEQLRGQQRQRHSRRLLLRLGCRLHGRSVTPSYSIPHEAAIRETGASKWWTPRSTDTHNTQLYRLAARLYEQKEWGRVQPEFTSPRMDRN